MSRYDRKLWKQRLIVVLHGLCGGIIGFGLYMLLLVVCMVTDLITLQSEVGYYVLFLFTPVIFTLTGVYLSVRNDYYILKRRF